MDLQAGNHIRASQRALLCTFSCLDVIPERKRAGVSIGSYPRLDHVGTRRMAEDEANSLNRTWSAYSEREQLVDAVNSLDLLVRQGSYVHKNALYDVLKRCIAQKNLILGARLHALAVKSGYECDVFLVNHIIRMYASHGRLEEAKAAFTKVIAPDRYMWASVVLAHAQHGQPTQAIRLYRQMRESGVTPDNYIFVAVLKACASAKDLSSGREVHADILGIPDEPNMFVGNCLVTMYTKCGSLEDARNVFDNLPSRDVVTWNAMIAGYAQHGLGQEALTLYRSMHREGITPADVATFVSILQACASVEALNEGKQVHAQIQERGLQADVIIGNSLVNMYAKCGSLDDAHAVFNNLPIRNVVTWTAMIAGYAQHGLGQEALTLYASMQQEGITLANAVTFACLLQACASIGALNEGKQLHAQIKERGLEVDVVVGNSLVDMYAKCGNLEAARKVFETLPTKNVVTWNAMISGYVHHGLGQDALVLYARMQLHGATTADRVTFICLLQACASVGALQDGEKLHAQIRKRGFESDVGVGSSLLDMYAKCGSLEAARRVFCSLPQKSVVTWNVMIGGYARHGLGQEALGLYACMQLEAMTQPDHVTFMSLLQACASVGALHEVRQLHAQIQEKGLETNVLVGSSLVDTYAKCGSFEDAHRVFGRMPTKDVVTWNAMIAGYVQHGLGQYALDLYRSMQQEGSIPANQVTFACLLKACAIVGDLHQGTQLHAEIQERGLETDVVVGNSVVSMYAKCGSLKSARMVFDRLPTRNVVTWNAMMAGYVHCGLAQEALALHVRMQQEGVSLDDVTFVSLVQACASVGALHQGKQFHAQIQDRGLETEVTVGSSLVHMYAKCGKLDEARRVFDRLPTRDVVTWNALLMSYAEHTNGQAAIQCFQEMREEGVVPNDTTFICLLVACSHGGLVYEGQHYFKMMLEDYCIIPTVNHYNCIVDLFGRSGRLDEAETMLRSMPCDDDYVGWTSLLSACKSHNDLERARRCYDRLIELDPKNAVAYILVGNIYAKAGRRRDFDRIEALRKSVGAWKKPAMACIEVNNKVHDFTVGEDRSDVSSKLKTVNRRLKEEGGHVPQTELVLKAVSEGEKEEALCGHAEKLALAYGLLNTNDGTTLLVTKNLRMCSDCHSSTTIMSHLEKREIIVRDAHRVHRFLNGSCSCGDRP